MHRTYLADIERGGRNVTIKSIENLARALQVSVENLLGQSEALLPVSGVARELGKILLIEDNPDDAELTLRAFKRAQFTNPVKVVGDGAEAIEFLHCTGRYAKRPSVAPQLVLLDLNLPGISGLQVLRTIKAHKQTHLIPVVVLTASRHDRNILSCSRLGAEHYIIKPVDFESFSRIAMKFGLHWALVPSPTLGS